MKKRILAATLAAVMVGGLLAGCGSSDKKSGSSKDSAKDGGKATLRFIDVSPSPERQKYYENAFAKFAS